jgi:uncharacterized protein (TIGR03435 family)
MRLFAVTLLTISLYGQAPAPDSQLAFDVASVKPAPPPEGPGRGMRVMANGGPGTKDPGLYTCLNFSLTDLLTNAYNVKRYQLNGPSWMESERFNVTAKVPEGATKEQFRVMLQNLLAERFKITVHHETKEMPMYELVVMKGGPKFKESVDDPAAPDPSAGPPPGPMGPPKLDKDGYPTFPAGRTMMMMMNGRARWQVVKGTMEQVASQLSNQVSRPVTDATGLKGKYDFTLTFAFDMAMMARGSGLPLPPPSLGGGMGGGAGGGAAGPAGASGPLAAMPETESGPTMIAAIQQQLGLKLEPKKGQVDIIVIDHAEKVPVEN